MFRIKGALASDDAGTIHHDYTGEDYDHADDAGSDDEYWCLECEAHSHDLAYLVGARDREEVTTNDEGAMRELEALLDAKEWSSAADYLEAIAAIVRRAGYRVREPLSEWTTDELRAELDRLKGMNVAYREQREHWVSYHRELAERIDAELDERG